MQREPAARLKVAQDKHKPHPEPKAQKVSGGGSGTGSTGGAPVDVGDPGYDPNYVSEVTGVVLDRNHNGIPDPLEFIKQRTTVNVDMSNAGFVKPK